MPIIDLPLTLSLDRANDYNIRTAEKASFKENTSFLHRGGLSPIYMSAFEPGFVDAYGRRIKIEDNKVYINGDKVYTSSGGISSPVRDKWRYNGETDSFEIYEGDKPVHGQSGVVIENDTIWADGASIGPVNRRADYFYWNNVLYETEQGRADGNRQWTAGSWSDNQIDYQSVQAGRLFTTYKFDSLSLNVGRFMDAQNFDGTYYNESLGIANNNSRCYSIAKGPGYCLAFFSSPFAPYMQAYDNLERVINCSVLQDPSSGQIFLPFDRIITQSIVLPGVDLRNWTSNVAENFNYVTTGGLVVYAGQAAGLTYRGVPTGPLAVFSKMFTNAAGTEHLYGDDFDRYYKVEVGVPLTAEKASEFVWMFSDGSHIVSSETETTFEPPVKLNLSFFSPLIESSAFSNASSFEASAYIMAGSNNANFEVTNNRAIGGIAAPVQWNVYGAPNVNIPATLIGYEGDYYIGSFVNGGVPSYSFSVTEDLIKITKGYLEGLNYPSPGANIIFPIPPNSTRIRTRTPAMMFKWADQISSIGLTNDNRTMLIYLILSNYYGSESFFYFVRTYYMFDGENIYAGQGTPGETSWQGSITAVAEGLQFLASDSSQALFYSPVDGWLYSFTGDFQVRPMLNLSNIKVSGAAYSPAMDCYALLTDGEVLLINKGILSCSVKGKYTDVDTTLNGFVFYNEEGAAVVSLWAGEGKLPTFQTLTTSYLTAKEMSTSDFKALWVRLQSLGTPVQVSATATTMLTLDSEQTKTFHQTVDFKEGKDFQIVKFPLASRGRATSFTFNISGAAQIQAVSLEVDNVVTSPVRSTQGSL